MARQRIEDEDERDEDYEEAPKKKRGRRAGSFEFDGTAGDFLPVFLVAFLLYMFTFGLAFPWVLCMLKKWESEHTLISGRRLRFDGTGSAALGLLLVSYILIVITFGIYSFWAVPKIQKWVVENTEFDDE
ncbi:MAG: DUF898 family protein [Planctomycetes bacterium]|nr:DUF898 family protein [Planctomycetota bacterium]